MENIVLLDTNIVSYLLKDDSLSALYLPHLLGKTLAVSFITVGELYYGAEKANWGDRRWTELEDILEDLLILPYDFEIARNFARIKVERETLGRPISLHDAWIAASGVQYAVPLVTHNPKDFASISNLQVISEGPFDR
jgi:predicted nucleic acid-binding protein